MDALLDEDDWRVDRITAAPTSPEGTNQYVAPSTTDCASPGLWIIDDYEIIATTGQRPPDRGRIPAAPRLVSNRTSLKRFLAIRKRERV
jgi:hypothetical protein